jgi:hypothetical protein
MASPAWVWRWCSPLRTPERAGASWSEQWRGALIPTPSRLDRCHPCLVARQPAVRLRSPRCPSVLVGTVDGGARWSVLTRFAQLISGVAFAPAGLGLAAAHAVSCRDRVSGPPRRCPGQVLISHDGGRRWRVVLRVTQPVVAVAAGRHGLWAVEARIGLPAAYRRTQPASFVLLRSGDGGRSWTARGAFQAGSFAGLQVRAQVLAGSAGTLVISPVDPDSCAIHGCGVDGVWRTENGGRSWEPLDLSDPHERGVGTACAYNGQVPVSVSPDGTIWEAPTFDRQDCRGPVSALFASTAGAPRLVHPWGEFDPAALSMPATGVGICDGSKHRAPEHRRRQILGPSPSGRNPVAVTSTPAWRVGERGSGLTGLTPS